MNITSFTFLINSAFMAIYLIILLLSFFNKISIQCRLLVSENLIFVIIYLVINTLYFILKNRFRISKMSILLSCILSIAYIFAILFTIKYINPY